jgi:hypothetical protein
VIEFRKILDFIYGYLNMNGIFRRLNRKKSLEKHPNSDYFFFQILDDFSPLPYFFWWANWIFIVIYYFVMNLLDSKLKITNLTKNNNFSKIYYLINDGFTIFIIFTIMVLTCLIFLKKLNSSTKLKIQNGNKWAQTGQNSVTSVELKSIKSGMRLFFFFIYLAIPFLLFRDLSSKEFWRILISNNLGNILFLEAIYITILTIFTSYIISKEF